MKILVYPHDLAVGGSQLNAIDIAHAHAEAGHDVVIYGVPGTLVSNIEERGIEFVASPTPRRRPSAAVVRHLREVVLERGIDVVHGYEWPPALEAALAVRGTPATAIATVMSMSVAPFVPRTMPLVVGTRQIADTERRRGRRRVSVIEPPVDLDRNCAAAVSTSSFVDEFALDTDALAIVTVTRLARELKQEGTLVAIDVAGRIARRSHIQLIVVGDGPARQEVRLRADAVNQAVGREVVVLTGELDDPRPAYAHAAIALGMGGSALRAMAFGTPLVVQGESGFWQTLTPDSVEQFLWSGWYGIGQSPELGSAALESALTVLIEQPELRSELGTFARETVSAFSLETAADAQMQIYLDALADPAGTAERAADSVRSTVLHSRYMVARKLTEIVGANATDDFNSMRAMSRQRVRP